MAVDCSNKRVVNNIRYAFNVSGLMDYMQVEEYVNTIALLTRLGAL